MTSLSNLEKCLHREFPVYHWHCSPASPNALVPGSQVPQNIEIRATDEAGTPAGGPWHLSGSLLLRWGQDSTARLFCQELAHSRKPSRQADPGWDKLAEI